MPSHTAHSALTRLHFTPGNEGAPWNFAAWQEMTGIKHGLFPKDDRLLPPTWTRRNSDDVQSYFLEYQSKKSEHDKLEFSAARRASGHDSTPGRAFFRDWVTAHWASIWKVNSRITKVLIDAGLHPMQILSDNDTLDVLPASSSYLPLSIDEIGRELYGTGPGITDAGGRLVGSLREPTMIMAQRAWQNNMSGVGKKKKKLEDLNEQARDSLKVLHAGQITVQTIRKAIRTVANFGKAVEACPTTGFSREVARLEEELRPFIPEDNHDAKGKASSDGKLRVFKNVVLTASATPEEIQQLYAEYDTWYGAGQDADGPDDFSFDNAALAPEFNLSDGIHDPGVEFEAKMSYSQLANRLGFKDGVPSLLFNTVRHIGGENTWSDRFEEIVTSDPDAIEPFALLWHQLGGIHAILRNVLGKEPSSSACRGMLIADDVGLGKTVQSAATIAFLAEASVVQERNLTPKLPQILVDCPYLGESQTIEPLPHLIIVPGTLMAQWEHELKCFFRWKFVDVLLYKSGLKAHREFFRPDGHFLSSPYPPSHRIVIASLSALQQDFGQLYGKERHLGSLPWENPVPLPTFTASRPYTLFGHRWMTCVIDEAQGVRNIGRKHFAALTLLEQATVRLILTATPLQTSTKDLAAMGRLIGLEHFFSQVSHSEQASDATSLRRAKQDREDMLEVPEPDEDPILLAQHQISARLQTKFEGRVIRRTAASLNHNGKPLLPLTPFTSTQLIARLTERELAILEKITQDDADDAGTAAARGNAGSKFYLEHRMGVTWPRPRGEVVPTFDTLAAWEENGSTKIKLLVSVIRHILSRDDMPLIYLDNDEIVFPPAPDSLQLSQTVKAVVYMEFPIFIGLVKSVFALHGIKGLAISGRTTMEQRSSIVRKFNNDAEHRVLIFSKVGSTGLNLTRASYVVLLDQPWSAQDEHQIVGRVWRQKQKRHVQAIHLLAADTADITLAGMALGKKAMLDSFLTTQSSKDLFNVMTGQVGDEDVDGDDEKEGEAKGKKTRRRKTTTRSNRGKSRRATPSPDLSQDPPIFSPIRPLALGIDIDLDGPAEQPAAAPPLTSSEGEDLGAFSSGASSFISQDESMKGPSSGDESSNLPSAPPSNSGYSTPSSFAESRASSIRSVGPSDDEAENINPLVSGPATRVKRPRAPSSPPAQTASTKQVPFHTPLDEPDKAPKGRGLHRANPFFTQKPVKENNPRKSQGLPDAFRTQKPAKKPKNSHAETASAAASSTPAEKASRETDKPSGSSQGAEQDEGLPRVRRSGGMTELVSQGSGSRLPPLTAMSRPKARRGTGKK